MNKTDLHLLVRHDTLTLNLYEKFQEIKSRQFCPKHIHFIIGGLEGL